MHPAFPSLILIALHAFAPLDCAPRTRDPPLPHQHLQQESSMGKTHTNTHTRTHTGRHTHSDGAERHFLVILPKRTSTKDHVSIFDLRRKRFLCVDFQGELYNSRQADADDCVFLRFWSSRHQETFYSTSGGRLLKPGADRLRWARPEPPPPPSEDLLIPTMKRKRRSEAVNPSDPLRTESHPKDAADHQPEQDQTGAVSKETIASCDDPLRVLRPSAPGSPIQDRAGQD
ncbi:unnamed protein product [Ophioblennius macclurei]